MAGFGNGTDHFGKDSASLTLIETSTTPAPVSIEQVQDESGNTVAEDSYAGGPAAAIECTYRLVSGTLDLSTLKLGYLLVGAVKNCVTDIEVNTSNGEWPTIKLSGFTVVTNETDMDTWTLPAITISGKKLAQGLDFTVDAACRLTSSSLKASAEFHHTLDDAGIVAAMAVTGANLEISAEMVEVTGVAAWTPGGTWIETQAPGASNGNISWGTSSATASKFLAADA
jgi:hypothetical protein